MRDYQARLDMSEAMIHVLTFLKRTLTSEAV